MPVEIRFNSFVYSVFRRLRVARIMELVTPPVWHRVKNHFLSLTFPTLPAQFADLPRGQHAAFKLVRDFEFMTLLDIGSGEGQHAAVFSHQGKNVTALDLGTSDYAEKAVSGDFVQVNANFYDYAPDCVFDCIWACHVLEHQPDPGKFLQKCVSLCREGGVLAITVPPMKEEIEGGHLTVWNAGLLLYQLAFLGLDVSQASVLSHGYNISVITNVDFRPKLDLCWDGGDIETLKPYMPSFVEEPFNGRVVRWNW